MILFVDASAIVAIMLDEPDAALFVDAIVQGGGECVTNGVAIWEAARAVSRNSRGSLMAGLAEVERYRSAMNIAVVPIAAAEAVEAVTAQHRYGKGTGHPARLNMGDCFAYACARTNRARLLYKGDDFIHTDLA